MSSLDPALRAWLEFPDPSEALHPQGFIESTHPQLQALAASLGKGGLSGRELAVAAFEHVRDAVPYEFMAKLTPGQYRASYVLDRGRGFCVQKAVLLTALLRACGIPSAIVLSELRDRTMPRRISQAMGTDIMHGHGLTAVFLDGEWLLVDASHDASFAERKEYETVTWDGQGDALIAATTLDGRPHAEFVALQGVFLDLPFEALLGSFAEAYGRADIGALAAAGLPVAEMLSGVDPVSWTA
ncbi:MAG: transglutaminase family protein [Deltaproteobacteria bacterium]|nr:MAG: transglutaminase family protein [Deltaproteobacteria bacterium]